MPTDHRAQVEELLADYRRSRDQLQDAQRELSSISEKARSADGSVEVTVGPHGVLSTLTLTDAAYRLRPAQLSATIVELTVTAARAAAARAQEVLAPVLPSGADPSAILEGRADLDPQPGPANVSALVGTNPSGEPRWNGSAPADDNHDGDDDYFGNGSWLEDTTAKRS